ncbi:hypothetical protein EXIGLDRAFT_758985 [Exidia glandulosa HHB12029]|uniref:Uncharacterized protein n=1 Tax=Exidia glandulosa HHB12029 TaxID=1314781 RepID=A0A165QHX7_EXIGL|nr:hypothetical protein EXIGLDRAFT_758985 [Exidia glandulosa HHB12029]
MATRLEPMNASQHHSKVKVTVETAQTVFVAGEDVKGVVHVETRADTGLGISVIQVELIAVQELTSRDHTASSTFLHSRRMFQGPGLPPSNAVEALPKPGDPIQLPQGYWPARRGTTKFFFQFPVPLSAPSSITFGNGVAKVTYRLKATVGVVWKGEKRLVTDLRDAELVECALPEAAPTGTVVVGENGKIWMQGRLVGGVGVSGHPSCVELSVRNHTAKKASGLQLTLLRRLHLAGGASGKAAPFELSDTLLSVPFKGPEYTVVPGGEGIANLVFDIPRIARGVRGGPRESLEGDQGVNKLTDPLFEVRCFVQVKLNLGIGSKDLILDLPINIMHPAAIPELAAPVPNPADPYAAQIPYPLEAPRPPFMGMDPHSGQSSPMYQHSSGYSPGTHPHGLPLASPGPQYAPHPSMSPQPGWPPQAAYFAPPPPTQPYYYPPPPDVAPVIPGYPVRPSSADPYAMPPMPMSMHNVPPPAPVHYHGTGSHPVSVHHTGARGLPMPPGAPSVAPAPVRQESGLPAMPVPVSITPAPAPSTPQRHNSQTSVPKWVLGQEPSPPSNAPLSGDAGAAAAAAVAVEEGKGERASRIAHNLHQSRRDRSASPTSRRFVSPRASRASKPVLALNGLPPRQTVQQMQAEMPVLSPRPVLSPKRSFANLNPGGTVRSDNVESLERMVEEDVMKEKDRKPVSLPVSGPGGFPALGQVDKTLPGPPVPSGKERATAPSTGVPRATDIFGVGVGGVPKSQAQVVAGLSAPKDDAPRGATLTIPTRSSGFIRPNGGLEALEKRLLADVGTTKVQARVAEAESESVLKGLKLGGVAEEKEGEYTVEELLQLSGGVERALDKRRLSRDVHEGLPQRTSHAAIDLTAVRPHGSDVPIVSSAGLPPMTASQERKVREQEDPARKAEEKKREEEATRLRQAAKGRIANWLGGVSPEPVPEPVVDTVETIKAHRRASAEVDRTRRISQPTAAPEVKEMRNLGVEKGKEESGRARGVSDATMRKGDATLSAPNLSDDAYRTRRISLPQPARADAAEIYDNPWTSNKPAAAEPTTRARPTSLVHSRSQPSVLAASPPNPLKAEPAPAFLDMPKTKAYDVRSARGGKGGKVAAVAAIWAAASSGSPASAPAPAKAPLSPKPKKFDIPSAPKKLDVSTPLSPGPKPRTFDFPASPKPTPGPAPKLDSPAVLKSVSTPRLATTPTTRAAPPLAPKPAPPPIAPKPAGLIGEKRVTSPTSPTSSPGVALRPTPATKPASTSTNVAARMIKSTSVPAILSPSTAKPTLSSTASLARPVTLSPVSRPAPATRLSGLPEQPKKLPGAAAALRHVQAQESAPVAAPKPELQFGKARLKELIQKYQDGR